MPCISIIVPIYNVKDYLEKCINSITEQTLTDIEIFLASDGPEDCHKICDDYLNKDKRIKVLKNLKGYGKSINRCIKEASGEYIGIVESDDWIAPDMYEKLYKEAVLHKADIAKCGFWFAYDDLKQNNFVKFVEKNKTFTLTQYPEAILFRQTIWSAIYKRDFLIKNKIYLCEERISYIDAPFQAESFFKANKIAGITDPLYFYYQQNPSQSMADNKRFATDGIKVKEIMLNKISSQYLVDKRVKAAYLYHICRDVFNDYNRQLSMPDKEFFWTKAHPLLQREIFKKIDYSFFSKKEKIFTKMLRKYKTNKHWENLFSPVAKITFWGIPIGQIFYLTDCIKIKLFKFIPFLKIHQKHLNINI